MRHDMEVRRGWDGLGDEPVRSAVTIGNFDGVHCGHRRLVDRVLAHADRHGWLSVVLTFDPHPTRVLAPSRAPRLLTTLDERLGLLASLGVQRVVVLPFDTALAQLSAEAFIADILVARLRAGAIVVGDNFRFGHRQAGDTALLRSLGEQHGYTTEVVPALVRHGLTMSSSEIRRSLGEGLVGRAARMLGRPYAVAGDVVRGQGIGSRQTVPTLNLDTGAEILPTRGVYVTRTLDLDGPQAWPSITNIGVRPTFDGAGETIETYLLAPLEGDAPARIRVEFLRWVRAERRFESPDKLKAQILRDVGRAQAYHRRLARWTGESNRSKPLMDASH